MRIYRVVNIFETRIAEKRSARYFFHYDLIKLKMQLTKYIAEFMFNQVAYGNNRRILKF